MTPLNTTNGRSRFCPGMVNRSCSWAPYGMTSAIMTALSGIAGAAVSAAAPTTVAKSETYAYLTILYGSETGHSHELAEKLAAKAANKNISVKVVNMYDYNHKKIGEEENLAIIVSTHGEGDPPDMAADFHKFIKIMGDAESNGFIGSIYVSDSHISAGDNPVVGEPGSG